MERLDYWKICTDFTVVQVALIVCGIAPEQKQWEVERTADSHCPPGYVAIRTALQHGLQNGSITPTKSIFQCDDAGDETRFLDIQRTTIAASEIDRFLKSMGRYCEFFDEVARNNSRANVIRLPMPAKLAAAVKAWEAVSTDPSRLRGKSPKQALEQWLLENAKNLGLTNRDGQPNRTGIEEICKVANWKPEGGATPTPVSIGETLGTMDTRARPLIRLPPPPPPLPPFDLDDEIPF